MIQVYLHRLRRYIGAFLVQLGGKVDAIVFSAGMGENSAVLRGRALQDLQVLFLTSSMLTCLARSCDTCFEIDSSGHAPST